MKSLFLILFLPLLVHCQQDKELDCGFLNSTFEYTDWNNVEKSYVGGCCTSECVKILDQNYKNWRKSNNPQAMFVSELYHKENCCNDTPSRVGTTETSTLTTITSTSDTINLIPTTPHSVSQETTTLSSTTPISTVLPTTTESSSTRSVFTGTLECGVLTNTPCCTPVITRCLKDNWLSYGSIDEFGKDLKDCGCLLTTTSTTTSTETPEIPSNSSSCGWLATSFNYDNAYLNGIQTNFSYNGTCCTDVAVNTLKNGYKWVLNANATYNQWDYLVNLLYCVEGACTDPPRWDNCSMSSTSSSSSTSPQTTTSSKWTSSDQTTDSTTISTNGEPSETTSTHTTTAASTETKKRDDNDETTTIATTTSGSTSDSKTTESSETTSTKLSSEGSTGTGTETTTLTTIGESTTSTTSTTISTGNTETETTFSTTTTASSGGSLTAESTTSSTSTTDSIAITSPTTGTTGNIMTTSEGFTTPSTSTMPSTPITSQTSGSTDTTEITMKTPTSSTPAMTESSTAPTSTTTEATSSASTTSGQTASSTTTTEVTGTTPTSAGSSGVSTTSGTTETTTGTSGASTSTSTTGSTTTTGSGTTTNTDGVYSSTTPMTTAEQTSTFAWATGGTTRILPSGEIILSESLISYKNCTTVLMQLIFNPSTNKTRTESSRDINGCKTSTTPLMTSTTPMTTPTPSSTAKTTTYNWPTGGTTKILPSGEIILSESLIAYDNCTTVLKQLIFNPSTNKTRTETTTDEYGCRTSTSTSSKFSTTPTTTTTSKTGTTASTYLKTTTYNWPTGGTTKILPSGEIILSESLFAYNNCTTLLMQLIFNPRTNKTRTETTSDAEGCKTTSSSSAYITTPMSGGSTTPSPSDTTTSFQWPTGGTTRMLPSGEIIISESLIAFKNCTTILMQLIYSPKMNTTRTETTADANGCKSTSTGSPGVTSSMTTPTTTEAPFTFPDSKTTQILPNGEIILSESLTAYPNCTTVLKQLIFNPATNTTRTKTSSDAQGCKTTSTTKPSASTSVTTPIPPTTTTKSFSTTPVASSTVSPVTTYTEKVTTTTKSSDTTPIPPKTTTKSSSTTPVTSSTVSPVTTTTTSPRLRTRSTTAVPVTCPFPSNLNLQNTNRPTPEEIKESYAVGGRIIHICKKYYIQELSKQPLRIYQCGEDGKWIGTLQKCVLEPGRKAEL